MIILFALYNRIVRVSLLTDPSYWPIHVKCFLFADASSLVILHLVTFDRQNRSVNIDSINDSGSFSVRASITDAVHDVVQSTSTMTEVYKSLGGMSTVLPQIMIIQTVNCEIETGVQMRQHGCVQVNRQRQPVGAII